MDVEELKALRARLKSGEYDGVDIMNAGIAIDDLIAKTAEGAEVALDCGVMPNGHYWINDKSRYGWEVVRILGGNLYRFGISGACNLDKNKFEFTRIEEPK